MNDYWNDCGASIRLENNYSASMIFEMEEINYFGIAKDDHSSLSQDDSSITYSKGADGSIIIHMDEINNYGDISDSIV